MSGSKSALDAEARYNRLVREDQISFMNKPGELLGDDSSSVEMIRDSVLAIVPPVGVHLGDADTVVPWTRTGLDYRANALVHPSEYGAPSCTT